MFRLKPSHLKSTRLSALANPLLPLTVSGPRTINVVPPVTSKSFSTTSIASSSRANEINRFRKEQGLKYADYKVPTKTLLDSLRALVSERALSNNHDKSNFYRDGLRDIAQAGLGKAELSVGEIEEVLTPENGVTWRAVINLATTGVIPELEKLDEDTKSMIQLHRVHGLGDRKAKSYVLHKGIKTLEDLAAYPKITKAQRIGLEHLDDIEQMIPRSEIDVFKGLLTEALANSNLKPEFEITGSYRRGETVCSDIDVIVWHESYNSLSSEATIEAENVIQAVKLALADAKLLHTDKLMANGKKKLMGLTRLPDDKNAIWRRIDIRVCPFDARVYFLLANSGDDTLMMIMRGLAKHEGRTLNEFGYGQKVTEKNSNWFVEGTMIPAENEEEVFKHLGLPYLAPHQRSYKHYKKILPPHFLIL